jgi:glycerol-3-phosphate acyltransferase PlsX
MSIVLDAMGSDENPKPEIEAAKIMAKDYNEKIILTGNKDVIFQHTSESELAELSIEIVHAEDILEMGDKAIKSAQQKPNNSMAVGLKLVKDGKADAFFTAGNTGAAMFNSLRILGRIKNVARPALIATIPTMKGSTVILDIGANADCRPEFLQQFAIMGSVYAEKMLGVTEPAVGLLNNGEEPGKGNELARNTYELLKQTQIKFIGNIEAKELFAGKANVVVMDGFTGNVLLKTAEATAKMLTDLLKQGILSSPVNKLGGMLIKGTFRDVKAKLDPNEIGSAPLLGIDGLSFIGHGRSTAKGLVSGMKLIQNAIQVDLVGHIRAELQQKLSAEG